MSHTERRTRSSARRIVWFLEIRGTGLYIYRKNLEQLKQRRHDPYQEPTNCDKRVKLLHRDWSLKPLLSSANTAYDLKLCFLFATAAMFVKGGKNLARSLTKWKGAGARRQHAVITLRREWGFRSNWKHANAGQLFNHAFLGGARVWSN
jgi:hypothetical protein